jgi:hypothetical protein
MLRAALFTLLVVSLVDGFLPAQRAAATLHGGGAVRFPVHSDFLRQRGFRNTFFRSRSHLHHDGSGYFSVPYFFPENEPFEYEQPDAEVVMNPVSIPPTPEPRIPKAQVIEIPGAANSTAAKMLPPTVFILANGERLETRRFTLTASNLSFSINGQQRTLSRDLLDLDATITANQKRGINLRVPADRNEISLSF